MITRVVMPPLSETEDEGTISRWLLKEGDKVEFGDVLLEVESDKAVVEVESFGAGVLRKILTEADETVPVGTLIAIIADEGEDIGEIAE